MNRLSRQRSAREMVNAIFFYVQATGCPSGEHSPRATLPENKTATPLSAGDSAVCGIRCCANRCAPRRAGGLILNVTIIDSQPVKAISKGGQRGDMTQAKRSKGASVT